MAVLGVWMVEGLMEILTQIPAVSEQSPLLMVVGNLFELIQEQNTPSVGVECRGHLEAVLE